MHSILVCPGRRSQRSVHVYQNTWRHSWKTAIFVVTSNMVCEYRSMYLIFMCLNCGFSIPFCVRIMDYFIGPSLHNNMAQGFYYA